MTVWIGYHISCILTVKQDNPMSYIWLELDCSNTSVAVHCCGYALMKLSAKVTRVIGVALLTKHKAAFQLQSSGWPVFNADAPDMHEHR